jgi:hypothetical protein
MKMSPAEKIERLFAKSDVTVNSKVDDRIINDAVTAFDKSEKVQSVSIEQSAWRIIEKNKITKLAAAAVMIAAVGLSVIFLNKSVTTVYALGQTVEANRTMRYLHLRYFDTSHEDVAKECWLEFDQAGQPTNVRINWSEWMAGGEIVAWNQDETQILNKKRNFLMRFNDEIYTDRMLAMARRENPRLIVERLYERQAKGEVEIKIEQPARKTEPVIVTSTGLGDNTKRLVLFVNQATNLVTRLKWYQ